MSLRSAFAAGASGLRVSQTGLSVVGHNIANADTEGYSRQRVEAAAIEPSVGWHTGIKGGHGAQVASVTRAADAFLEGLVRRDSTLLGFYEGRENTLISIEQLQSGPDESRLSANLDAFFDASRTLSQDPSGTAARETFLAAAERTAAAFRDLSGSLEALRDDVDDDLSDRVNTVNELAADIARLNARILAAEGSGAEASDLRDLQDQSIRALSKEVDIDVSTASDGSVTVQLAAGLGLVQGDRAASLAVRADPALGGHLAIDHLDAQGNATDLTASLDAGAIGGLLEARDGLLGGQIAALDDLAFAFANRVNAVHQAGFDLDGNPGQALFVPLAAATGAAAALTVSPAVAANGRLLAAATDAAAVPGDNRNALALADLQLESQAGLGNATFNERFGELTTELGQTVSRDERLLEQAEVQSSQSEALRESVTGVSVDDEMIDLTRFQKHFEANARVLTVVDSLLDSVLALVR